MIKSITTNLMVNSVEETIIFYKDTLDFSLVTSVPNEKGTLDFAIMCYDNLMLMFQAKESFTKEYPILNTDMIKPSISLYITVDNFDETYQTIKSKITLLADVHKTSYGATEFAIVDNNGYVITLTENHE